MYFKEGFDKNLSQESKAQQKLLVHLPQDTDSWKQMPSSLIYALLLRSLLR